MRHSRFVLIDSSCKSPDALPELWKTPYFPGKNQTKSVSVTLSRVFFLHISGMYFQCIERFSERENQAEISMPYLQGIMQVSLPLCIDNTTGCC